MAEGAVSSLVGKVVDTLFGVAKKEISYMSNSSKNVEDLKRENEKLTQMRDRVKQLVTQMRTLCRYGKMAANKTPSLLKHQEDGETFERCVSVPTPAPGVLDVYQRHNIDDLDTHKLCFKRIMESTKDENICIIGIYGIGGEKFLHRLNYNGLKQTEDAGRIKKEVELAAKRIIKGDKILVILDDAWGELKLDEVCIPCGAKYKNCKILLTSRSEDVCKTMKATCLISVDSLPTEEAWILFKRVVGDRVETEKNLKEIAEKVVEGCGGLPLIIQVVG
ncbi:disease resistance protein-like protein, partial [Tanacetum coccineum]